MRCPISRNLRQLRWILILWRQKPTELQLPFLEETSLAEVAHDDKWGILPWLPRSQPTFCLSSREFFLLKVQPWGILAVSISWTSNTISPASWGGFACGLGCSCYRGRLGPKDRVSCLSSRVKTENMFKRHPPSGWVGCQTNAVTREELQGT